MNKKSVMGIIIPADVNRAATIVPVDASLQNLQCIVGGYLEEATRGHAVAYMHEDGKNESLPPNPRATAFMIEQRMMVRGDQVVGNVVVLGFDEEGNDADLPIDVGLSFMEQLARPYPFLRPAQERPPGPALSCIEQAKGSGVATAGTKDSRRPANQERPRQGHSDDQGRRPAR